MRVLLYDHSGSLNHGCEALVRTTVDIIEKAFPGSEFGLCSYSAEEDIILSDIPALSVFGTTARSFSPIEKYINAFYVKALHSYDYYYKTAYSKTLDFAADYDICLIIGGDTFCYGNNELCRSITAQLKKRGKKVVLWGCSIGKEDLSEEKLKTLRSLDAVFARESLTKAVLEAEGIENVSLFPDPAFTLTKNEPSETIESGKKLLGINFSPLVAELNETFSESCSEFLEFIEHRTDYVPVLIPHVMVPDYNDHEFLSTIAKNAKSEKSILLSPDMGAKDYKGYISQCDMFIGARTHSIIAAYSTLVPSFAIGYSIKARGIAKDLFGTELCVRGVDKITCGDDLIKCFEELCENRETMKKMLIEKIPQTVSAAYSAGEALKNIL